MEKYFIPYEQALALKKLGFDEPCFGFYNDMENNKLMGGNFPCDGRNSAPLYQQVFRWFREKYDLYGNVGIKHFIEKTYCYNIVSTIIPHYIYDKSHFASYEEAELECLKKLIEVVKNK